ncbi:MAG: hypothetical protein ACLTT1_07240 [[Clostridium] scindens]
MAEEKVVEILEYSLDMFSNRNQEHNAGDPVSLEDEIGMIQVSVARACQEADEVKCTPQKRE